MKSNFQPTDAMMRALIDGRIDEMMPAALKVCATRPTIPGMLCDLDMQIIGKEGTVLANLPLVRNMRHGETVTIVQALPKGAVLSLSQ